MSGDRVSSAWERVPLRRIATLNPPVPEFSAAAPNAEVSFLPLEAIWPGEHLDVSRVRPKAEVESGYTRFKEGDILIPKITPTFQADRSVIATGLTNGFGCGTTELHVLRPGPLMTTRFAKYVVSSHPFLQGGTASMVGVAGQKRVPESFVLNFRAPLPALAEQQAIADFLDTETGRIDALIEKRRNGLALGEKRLHALSDHLLSPHFGRTVRLRHAASGVTVGVVVNPSTYVEEQGTVPFFRGVDVRRFHIDVSGAQRISEESNRLLCKSTLRTGDIVSVRVGEPGVSAVVPPEADRSNCASLLITRRSEGVDSRYLSYVFNSPFGEGQFRALANGAAQLQVNVSDAVDFLVPLPVLDEQQRIADQLDCVRVRLEVVRECTERQVGRLLERRQALITAAVSGELDVGRMSP